MGHVIHDAINGLEVGLVGGDRPENYCSKPRRGQKNRKSQVRLVGRLDQKKEFLILMTVEMG